MEIVITVVITTAVSIALYEIFARLLGVKEWRKEKAENQPIEKPPTRNSIYADHVINTATRIYCNYSESKIIRLGGTNPKPEADRQGRALKDAFNLVNRAYAIFDNLDKDEKQIVN